MIKTDKNTARQSAIKPRSDTDVLLLGTRAGMLLLALYWQSERHFRLAKTLIQREFVAFFGKKRESSTFVDSAVRQMLLGAGFSRMIEPKPLLVHLPEKAAITDYGWLFIGLVLHHFGTRGLFLVPLSTSDVKHLKGLPQKTVSINIPQTTEEQRHHLDDFVNICSTFREYVATAMSNKYNRYQMTHIIRQWARAYDMEIVKLPTNCPQDELTLKITVLLSDEEKATLPPDNPQS